MIVLVANVGEGVAEALAGNPSCVTAGSPRQPRCASREFGPTLVPDRLTESPASVAITLSGRRRLPNPQIDVVNQVLERPIGDGPRR